MLKSFQLNACICKKHYKEKIKKQQKENRLELHRLPILFIFLNYLSILFALLKNNSLLRKVSEEIISRREK